MPPESIKVAAINCGRTCREAASQAAILQSVNTQLPGWFAVFLSEVDAVRGSDNDIDSGFHTLYRHWDGPRTLPLALYLKSSQAALGEVSLFSGTCRTRASAVQAARRNVVLKHTNHICTYGSWRGACGISI